MTALQKRLARWARKQKGCVTVTIPWRKCADVPKFLKRLDRYEKASRKSTLQLP